MWMTHHHISRYFADVARVVGGLHQAPNNVLLHLLKDPHLPAPLTEVSDRNARWHALLPPHSGLRWDPRSRRGPLSIPHSLPLPLWLQHVVRTLLRACHVAGPDATCRIVVPALVSSVSARIPPPASSLGCPPLHTVGSDRGGGLELM